MQRSEGESLVRVRPGAQAKRARNSNKASRSRRSSRLKAACLDYLSNRITAAEMVAVLGKEAVGS